MLWVAWIVWVVWRCGYSRLCKWYGLCEWFGDVNCVNSVGRVARWIVSMVLMVVGCCVVLWWLHVCGDVVIGA